MDPKANIDEQRTLATALLHKIDTPTDEHGLPLTDQRPDIEDDVARLCELVLELDIWRTRGGFDPYGPTFHAIGETDRLLEDLGQIATLAGQPGGPAVQAVEALMGRAAAWDAVDEALRHNDATVRTEYSLSAADVCAVGFAQQQHLRGDANDR